MKVYLRFTALDMILNNLKELVAIHKLRNLKISTFDPLPSLVIFRYFFAPPPPLAKMTSSFLKIQKYLVCIFSPISIRTFHYTWVVYIFLVGSFLFRAIKTRLEIIWEDPVVPSW